MTHAEFWQTALQFCGVFMLSRSRAAARGAGAVLLAASLCAGLVGAGRASFTLVLWVWALAFAVIAVALLHTVKRQWLLRKKGAGS